jgi:tetratricopeptide (TPR) repeat protein
MMREADAHFAAGRVAEALGLYERVAESAPMHFVAVKMVGRCHDALGDAALAEDWLRRAISMQPLDAQAYLFLESALSRQKKLKEMFANAYRAVAAQPLHPWAWIRLADLLAQAKRPLSRLRLKPCGAILKNPKKPGLVLEVAPGTPAPVARVWQAYVDEASSGIRDKKTAFKQEHGALSSMIDEAKSQLAKGAALPPELTTLVSLADPDTLTGVTFVLRFRDAMRIEFEAWKRGAPSAASNPAVMVELFVSKTKLRPV